MLWEMIICHPNFSCSPQEGGEVNSSLQAAPAGRCVQGRFEVLRGFFLLLVLLLDDVKKNLFSLAEGLFKHHVSVCVDGSPATFAALGHVLVTHSHPPFHHSIICFLQLHHPSKTRTWFNACVCSWESEALPGFCSKRSEPSAEVGFESKDKSYSM